MLWARGSLGVVAVDESLYAIGGFDSMSALSVVEVLDTRAMQWRSLQNLNTERSYGGAVVAGGQVCQMHVPYCPCYNIRHLRDVLGMYVTMATVITFK